jgi:hypothetical protein
MHVHGRPGRDGCPASGEHGGRASRRVVAAVLVRGASKPVIAFAAKESSAPATANDVFVFT